MADKVVFKMFLGIFFFVIIPNASLSLAASAVENLLEKCNCFNICTKNLTTNAVDDAPKIAACQRGCRFYLLDLHKTRDLEHDEALKKTKEGCLNSCTEGYPDPGFKSACHFGCYIFDIPLEACGIVEEVTLQMSYSVMIEESDVLIHSGEPEPDDSLTDPALRKQIQRTLVAMLESTPKLPDIHFKSLPVKEEKPDNSGFKCPKFYGLDSNFEFRNGKMIIGDLYLFAGVLIFVVLCFFLSHHLERRNLKRQLMESRIPGEEFEEKNPLLKLDYLTAEEELLEKSEVVFPMNFHDTVLYPEPYGKVAFVFSDEDLPKDEEFPGKLPRM